MSMFRCWVNNTLQGYILFRKKDAGVITIQNDKLKKTIFVHQISLLSHIQIHNFNLQLVISPNTIHHSPHYSGKIAKQNL